MIFKTITNDLNGAINKIGIFNRSFADLKNAISANGIKGLFNSISPAITSNDLSLIKEYNRLVGVEGVSSQSAWYRTMLSSSKSAQALFDDENNLIRTNNGLVLSEEALARATNTMTLSAKAGQVALQAFTTVLNVVAFTLIAKGIEAVATKIHDLATESETAKEKAEGFASSVNKINENIAGDSSKLSELNSRCQELSNGVNSLGENVSLSTSNYAEYKDIISQISSIMPGLTTYFNAQGEKIGFVKGHLEDLLSEFGDSAKYKIVTI